MGVKILSGNILGALPVVYFSFEGPLWEKGVEGESYNHPSLEGWLSQVI